MDHMKELIAVHKPIMLDGSNFGDWKVKIRYIICGIDEEAWASIFNGWTERTLMNEKRKQAISTIFSTVYIDQFKIIQYCESAKDSWNTLVNYFEGDSSVKRTRLDHLETKWENLRMEEDEPLGSFTNKLNMIENEAAVLGEKYKKEAC
ncbi:hypothetical protein BRARA_H00323 [Brassica rapa]|uniref:DUF4219 domain-containing protein n=1 Tax=Brassica campestris TaxID=3711 RepID=A0A397Y7F7_BRACM|nr:hypothetical protein BRARA_H00323 [Brassica rapa]